MRRRRVVIREVGGGGGGGWRSFNLKKNLSVLGAQIKTKILFKKFFFYLY